MFYQPRFLYLYLKENYKKKKNMNMNKMHTKIYKCNFIVKAIDIVI